MGSYPVFRVLIFWRLFARLSFWIGLHLRSRFLYGVKILQFWCVFSVFIEVGFWKRGHIWDCMGRRAQKLVLGQRGHTSLCYFAFSVSRFLLTLSAIQGYWTYFGLNFWINLRVWGRGLWSDSFCGWLLLLLNRRFLLLRLRLRATLWLATLTSWAGRSFVVYWGLAGWGGILFFSLLMLRLACLAWLTSLIFITTRLRWIFRIFLWWVWLAVSLLLTRFFTSWTLARAAWCLRWLLFLLRRFFTTRAARSLPTAAAFRPFRTTPTLYNYLFFRWFWENIVNWHLFIFALLRALLSRFFVRFTRSLLFFLFGGLLLLAILGFLTAWLLTTLTPTAAWYFNSLFWWHWP